MNILQDILDDFSLDFYEVEHIRENLPVIDVEDIPEEMLELLPEVTA